MEEHDATVLPTPHCRVVERTNLSIRVVVLGETAAVAVHQPRPYAPQRLGKQEAALPGHVQGGGMELDVLHAGQKCARPERHGEAGASSASRVGGVGVDVAQAPGGEHGGRRADGLDAKPDIAVGPRVLLVLNVLSNVSYEC